MDILKFDTVRVVSSVYAAFSSVRPIKLKSMTPFSGYSNRHGLIDGGTVVGAVVVVVPIANIIPMNTFQKVTHLHNHPNKHICVLNEIQKHLLDLHPKLQILLFPLLNIVIQLVLFSLDMCN